MGVMLLSQSGTMGIVLADKISKMKTIELEKLVSLGNMAGVDFADLIEYANDDEHTDVILIYLEDVKNGKKFMEAASKCDKPICVLRGGRSDKGAEAALSHTGALAGSSSIYNAAFKQAGIIQVDTIEELLIAAEVFSRCRIPKGNKVGILSPGGGANISCVDFCEGLEIPTFSDRRQEKILKYLPGHITSAPNPVDTGATFYLGAFHRIIYEMAHSCTIDVLIINYVMTSEYVEEWNDISFSEVPVNLIYQLSQVPIIGSWMGPEGDGRWNIEKFIPVFDEPSKAAFAAKLLVKGMK